MDLDQGKLIFQTEDPFGPIEVMERGNKRTLHFGTPDIQSDIDLRAPHQLTLGYMHTMLNALLLMENPKRILMIGLGGGSMARFLLHHYPECQIDAIECRQAVADIARDYFLLSDNPRLNIVVEDGGRFCFSADPSQYGHYDIILVDAFIGNSIARQVCGQGFSDVCHQRLTKHGLFAMNLWSGSFISSKELLEGISGSFSGQLVHFTVANKNNVVAIAYNGDLQQVLNQPLNERAQKMTQQLSVNFMPLLQQLKTLYAPR